MSLSFLKYEINNRAYFLRFIFIFWIKLENTHKTLVTGLLHNKH